MSPPVDPAILTIDRIYDGSEFGGKSFSGKWLPGTESYTTLEPNAAGEHQIIRYDAGTGSSDIMVDADALTPPQASSPLKVENYTFSGDQSLVLIYTNSKRVWRNNTRGDYWVLDRRSNNWRQHLSTMMFATLGKKWHTSMTMMFSSRIFSTTPFRK